MTPANDSPGKGDSFVIPDSLDVAISRVERHEQTLALNNSEFVSRYDKWLTSVDSWSRVVRRIPGKVTANNWKQWETRLSRLMEEVDGAFIGERIYPLPMLAEAKRIYNRLQGARGDIRVAWLVGSTGSGKTVALRYLQKTYPKETVYVFVLSGWRDRRSAILRGLADALGCEVQSSSDEMQRALIKRINAQPVTFLMDEFHEGGVALVSIVKELIECCPFVRFLLTTWKTGFHSLENGSRFFVTAQLVGRSLRPFNSDWENGPRKEDVLQYLTFSVPELSEEERGQLAREFLSRTKKWGFRTLAQVVGAAKQEAETNETVLTVQMLRSEFDRCATNVVELSNVSRYEK